MNFDLSTVVRYLMGLKKKEDKAIKFAAGTRAQILPTSLRWVS